RVLRPAPPRAQGDDDGALLGGARALQSSFQNDALSRRRSVIANRALGSCSPGAGSDPGGPTPPPAIHRGRACTSGPTFDQTPFEKRMICIWLMMKWSFLLVFCTTPGSKNRLGWFSDRSAFIRLARDGFFPAL